MFLPTFSCHCLLLEQGRKFQEEWDEPLIIIGRAGCQHRQCLAVKSADDGVLPMNVTNIP
jgi:hypothetical protein